MTKKQKLKTKLNIVSIIYDANGHFDVSKDVNPSAT